MNKSSTSLGDISANSAAYNMLIAPGFTDCYSAASAHDVDKSSTSLGDISILYLFSLV